MIKETVLAGVAVLASYTAYGEARDIGSSRHLWVDAQLTETMDPALSYKMHSPREEGPFPTQPSGYYMTILQDDDGLYRAYYRGYLQSIYGAADDEFTAYAESTDGINWIIPRLGVINFPNDPDQNAVLWKTPDVPGPGICHNLTPFIDRSPDCPPDEKFKAVGGTPSLGLYALVSANGYHWRVKTPPILPKNALYSFDGHNIAFWNTVTEQYELYYRCGVTPAGNHIRTVYKSVTDDFSQWDRGEFVGPNLPEEQLYTIVPNQYFRAPDYLLCFPSRFFQDRGCATDILFMSSWRGEGFERLYLDAMIRPGSLPNAWGDRQNYIAWGMVPVGNREVAVYDSLHKRRYVWRLDGFSSIHAGFEAGELITKPFIFEGSVLTINAETSAAGSIVIAFLDAEGIPIEGYDFEDMKPFYGDVIDYPVEWLNGKNLSDLAGIPVRMKIKMQEADMYSFKFE